ncbi:TetR/AcrR family transcriptional regulator [Paraburkholderia sp. SIMBA_049]
MPRPRQFTESDFIDVAISYFSANSFKNASMRKLALRADVSCGSLYNAFGNKQSMFRRALIRSVDRSFRPGIQSDQHRLSPLPTIERFFAEAIQAYAQPAKNDGRLLLRAGFESGIIDTESAELVSATIEAIESYLTGRVAAGQIAGEIINTQPAEDLGGLLLTTFLGLIILFRLRPERRYLEETTSSTLHQLKVSKID